MSELGLKQPNIVPTIQGMTTYIFQEDFKLLPEMMSGLGLSGTAYIRGGKTGTITIQSDDVDINMPLDVLP